MSVCCALTLKKPKPELNLNCMDPTQVPDKDDLMREQTSASSACFNSTK